MLMLKLGAPTLTFSPPCPFKPWVESQQTVACKVQGKNRKREGGGKKIKIWRGRCRERKREGEGPVLDTLKGDL